jgi:hypothetical protein
MRAHGKLGGQHKLPRMDNTGRLTDEMGGWLRTHQRLDAAQRETMNRIGAALTGGFPG